MSRSKLLAGGAVVLTIVAAVAATSVVAVAATKRVTMRNISLSPATVSVQRGDSVTWLWRDGSIRHDVRFQNGGFRASALKSRGTHTLTFRRRGTFRYLCSVHPGDMRGKVVVR